jgi:hypothetical protein
VAVGDVIEFGGYEWRVLDVQDGKALLLSEHVLEYRPFHDERVWITWEDCDLRTYLNSKFYDSFGADDHQQ